jgi:hypothetical protein
VRYVHRSSGNGREVRAIGTCAGWRRELAAQRPRYVVVTPVRFPFTTVSEEPREAAWTRSIPGARRVPVGSSSVLVFELTRRPRPGACLPPP